MNETRDDFLGGKVKAYQPEQGYRAGVDAVLLAASVPAKTAETVLELGCGVGVASLCLAKRTGAAVTGVERDSRAAKLAARNGLDVVQADLAALPSEVRERSFHHVFCNPPYFDRGRGNKSDDVAREAARGEQIPLSVWLDVATKRLRPNGTLTVIQDISRLQDVLRVLDDRLGRVRVLPIASRVGRPARLVIVQAKKASRAPFSLLAPLILHKGERHEADEETYTAEVSEILRHGAQLFISD
jgi:tRNA1(Val) A37 N6-methylase TrmN6